MHHPRRLLRDGLDQVVVIMAQRRRGDTSAEVEESSPVRREQPSTFTPLEREVGTVVRRHKGGDHDKLCTSV
jgi:hypothetical protein